MLFRIRLLFLTMIVTGWSVSAQEAVEQDGSILMASQKSIKPYRSATQRKLSGLSTWQKFVAENGSWAIQWNEKTRTPHRAYGKSIQINGFKKIDADNVEAAARRFINSHKALLKAGNDQLRLVNAQKINKKWYVKFRQVYEGMDVLLSEVELRIFEDGRVMAFGADFYPIIDQPAEPKLSAENAQDLATKYLPFSPYTDKTVANESLYLLPVETENSYELRPVYQVDVETRKPVGVYYAFVDAETGAIHWRHNRVRTIDTHIRINGDIHAETPLVPEVTEPFADIHVELDGVQIATDSLGWAVRDLTAPATLTIRFTGPWVNMQRRNGAGSVYTTTINPGDSLELFWDDSNSFADERDVFYHTNFVHQFLKDLDPVFTGLDYSMPCVVNIGSEDPLWPCNAYWNGTNTNFFSAGGGCLNTGTMPSVIYHEYGHGVNDLLYQQAGSPFGMINGATHEGIADVLSGMVEDESVIGRGFFGTAGGIRNMDNSKRYPDDITGSVHSDGEIIGGAFWDLRQSLGLEKATELFHFARWGTPDDSETGVAFSEWFLEVLIADDDDGDLFNGTPNFSAINDAFDAHGIGAGAFLTLTYNHTPLADTDQTTGSYAVDFELQGLAPAGPGTESFAVVYTTDNFATETVVNATAGSGSNYSADIPAQAAGTLLWYYVAVLDQQGAVAERFPSANGSYGFAVGFQSVVLDEMEAESGWTVGAPDDNATTGIWERTDPQATDLGSQPEDDHSPSGQECFVTDGRAGTGAGSFDVDGGKTTLFSPIYDMSTYQSPAIRYYKWYSNERGNAPFDDFWVVEISGDSGATWTQVENTNQPTEQWTLVQFLIEDYVAASSAVQMRFVAADNDPGSLVEACVDDFQIFSADGVTGVDPQPGTVQLPQAFILEQNYPNPFNPSTNMEFGIRDPEWVTLTIYDVLGRQVRTLVDGKRAAGYHVVQWDGTDNTGDIVSAGIYLYRIEAGGKSLTRKMLLVK